MSDAPKSQEERRTVWKWLSSDWTRAEVFDVLGKIGAVLVFAFAVAQYISSESWKKTELVASQIKEFHADKINKAVLTMLDYDPAPVELFPNKIFGKHVDVQFYQLINAIYLETDFTEVEFQVRQYFEHFLTSLSRFNYFLESEAMQPRELCAD